MSQLASPITEETDPQQPRITQYFPVLVGGTYQSVASTTSHTVERDDVDIDEMGMAQPISSSVQAVTALGDFEEAAPCEHSEYMVESDVSDSGYTSPCKDTEESE